MSGRTTNGDRRTLDRYYTDDRVATAVVRQACRDLQLADVAGLRVLEPHVGRGAWLKAWKAARVFGDERFCLDLDPSAPGRQHADVDLGVADFLEWAELQPPHSFDVVLGNPPFSKVPPGKKRGPVVAHKHITSARRIGKIVIMLTRVGLYTTSPKRRDWVVANQPRFVYDLAPRPSFTGGGTDTAEYRVGVFQHGWQGDTTQRTLWWK